LSINEETRRPKEIGPAQEKATCLEEENVNARFVIKMQKTNKLMETYLHSVMHRINKDSDIKCIRYCSNETVLKILGTHLREGSCKWNGKISKI
jgi:hypothetical protein